MADATSESVARWLLAKIASQRVVYQETVVYEINQTFGGDFVYVNDNGNLAIAKGVLKEFRKISPDVVWERGERCWRMRQPNDDAGRQQE